MNEQRDAQIIKAIKELQDKLGTEIVKLSNQILSNSETYGEAVNITTSMHALFPNEVTHVVIDAVVKEVKNQSLLQSIQ